MREVCLLWLVLAFRLSAAWQSEDFLSNDLDDVTEEDDNPEEGDDLDNDLEANLEDSDDDRGEKTVKYPIYPTPYNSRDDSPGTGVPADFARDIDRLRIPAEGDLPPSAEESDEERNRGEAEGDDSEESDDDQESDEEEAEDFHFDEKKKDKKKKGKKRPYVVNYEVHEKIPNDRKEPKPAGPVYPGPPPCPGLPPPTFPPPPPPPKPSTPKPPVIGKEIYPAPPYDSYFPTSYMSQSFAPSDLLTGPGPQAEHPSSFLTGPGLLGLQSQAHPGLAPFVPYQAPGPRHTRQQLTPHPVGTLFQPVLNHRPSQLSQRFPRRASPQRVIIRYHRPAFVIRRIQQIGPGADALFIRRPAPPIKEVHIHHHHDPGPVLHVHKNDDNELLEDAKFQTQLANQKFLSEKELEDATGPFAEPSKDFLSLKSSKKNT